jgi:hypothetical protein
LRSISSAAAFQCMSMLPAKIQPEKNVGKKRKRSHPGNLDRTCKNRCYARRISEPPRKPSVPVGHQPWGVLPLERRF